MGWGFRGFTLVMAAPYVIVGTAIAIRAPGNRIGRLLLVMGALYLFAGVANEYALRGLLFKPGSLPGAIYAAWYLQWAWVVMFGAVMFVFLLFPNGRFASPRWKRFSFVALGATASTRATLSLVGRQNVPRDQWLEMGHECPRCGEQISEADVHSWRPMPEDPKRGLA